MKKILSLIMMMTAICTNAQNYSKMSRYVRQLVITQNNNAAQAKGLSPTLSEAKEVLVFVKAPEEAVSQYCVAHQGDIHIIKIPVNMLASLSEDERVERIETSENNYQANLDSAASCINVKPLWEGASPLPQAYNGKGTIVGMVDIGFDFTHPTFRSATDDHLRIVRAWDMFDYSVSNKYNKNAQFPMGRLYTTTEGILEKGATTDSKTEWHGTHTGGIAAGSGYDTPYQGMAPEADIYAVGSIVASNQNYLSEEIKNLNTSTLTMLAYQRIFEYADSVGKPAVINYSISGPQDMTNEDQLTNDYINELTSNPGHILVASIGNDGDKRRYMPKSAETERVGAIMSTTGDYFVLSLSTQGTLTLRITDYSRTEAEGRVKDITLDFKPKNKKPYSTSGLKWEDFTEFKNIKELDSMSIKLYSGPEGLNPERVGYDVIMYNYEHELKSKKYALEVIGEGVSAEVFCQSGELKSGTTYSPTLLGAKVAGNCNSPASLPSVIGVGMTAYWELGNGRRWNRSSIGPTMHGLTKPDVMAPGYKVTSAYNSIYYANKGGDIKRTSTYNGKQYQWNMQWGTSMSTPIVSGIIALWLQADPTLTRERVMDVIEHTSRHPDETLTYPNNEYGYGEIDAYKGLLYILGIDHIEGLQAEHLTEAVARPVSGGVTVTLNGNSTTALPCRIYDTAGRLVGQFTITDGNAFYPLKSGVYAVQVGRLGSTLVRVE